MINWIVRIRTFRPMAALPRLYTVASETRDDAAYHLEGRYRQSEEGAFFFQYTLSGEGAYRDARGEKRVRAGEGFLCRNADPEVGYWFPPDAPQPWSFIWFGFNGIILRDLVDELIRANGAVYALDREHSLLEPFFTYRNMNGLTLDMDAASSARLVYDFLLGLAELNQPAVSEDGHVILAQKAMRFVRENISRDINANELANFLDVSREHFTRVFHEQTGATPYQYILRQKMLRACRYLKETDLSQKEIAMRVGYGAVENFSRSFSRFMRLSPGSYRKHGNPFIE